jgi:predicted flap endonuclease-1-like 5' DNA nuclease
MAKIIDVEGIGPAYAQKLQEAGISTTEDLLEMGASLQGRKDMAEKMGLDDGMILRWVNHVDLFRVKGVGEEYADLLEAAGVDTVPELAQRNPENLLQKVTEINEEKNLVRALPRLDQLQDWIEQAKMLPRKIEY